MQMKYFIYTLVLGLGLSSFSAMAEDRTWRAQPFTQSIDQKVSSTGDYTYSGVKVWTSDPGQPRIRFGCSEMFGLTANLVFDPATESDPTKSSRVKIRRMTTNMTIEGRETVRVPWSTVKEMRTVQTRRSQHAAMIYNAVVQGLTITVKEPYKKTVTITPPAVDRDFTWFSENCPVTAG